MGPTTFVSGNPNLQWPRAMLFPLVLGGLGCVLIELGFFFISRLLLRALESIGVICCFKTGVLVGSW